MTLTRDQKQAKGHFLAGELIGKEIKVVSSSCRDMPKVLGRIVDETTNTFLVEIKGKTKVVPKASSVFEINGCTTKGSGLIGKPEDRTKKLLSK